MKLIDCSKFTGPCGLCGHKRPAVIPLGPMGAPICGKCYAATRSDCETRLAKKYPRDLKLAFIWPEAGVLMPDAILVFVRRPHIHTCLVWDVVVEAIRLYDASQKRRARRRKSKSENPNEYAFAE